MTQEKVQNACLIVIDGWGVNLEPIEGDAIKAAKTPVMDSFEKEQLWTTVAAHGLSVGLPEGLMGNSEVGHLNIGAGRIVYQDIVRIELAVQRKLFTKNEFLLKAFENCKSKTGRLHFLGLVSDGGVHSHIKHLIHLIEVAKEHQIPEVFIHFFGDGRDTSPQSAVQYLEQLQNELKRLNYGSLATIIGRYYAMDRDKRWERIQLATEALINGKGEKSQNAVETVKQRYQTGENDEFLKPIILNEKGMIKENDTLVFFNFRSDRMRQLCTVFGQLGHHEVTTTIPKGLHITTMTQYKSDFPFSVLFPPQSMTNCLAEYLSSKNLTQMHVAETEKYAHVTFFFNGGTEHQYKGEYRSLLPSPKVATYDLKPEMSVIEVAKDVAKHLEQGLKTSQPEIKTNEPYSLVICNFAPPDMVGHTGKYEPAVKAVEATDEAIGIIWAACQKSNTPLFVTADHGNAEKMLAEDGKTPHTAHTTARVPFVLAIPDQNQLKNKLRWLKALHYGQEGEGVDVTGGALCDVAPTVLKVMGLEQPKEMTGVPLLEINK